VVPARPCHHDRGMLLAYQFSAIVQSRVSSIFSDIALYTRGETFSNVGDRFVMWKAAFSMFLSNPLMGVGTGDYMATCVSMSLPDRAERILGFNQPHTCTSSHWHEWPPRPGSVAFPLLTDPGLSLPLREANRFRSSSGSLPWPWPSTISSPVLRFPLFTSSLHRYTFAFIMGICVREA